MGRAQLIALLVIVVLAGALAIVRFGPSADAAASDGAAAPTETTGAESSEAPEPEPEEAAATEAPPVLRPAPELTEIDGWLQTDKDSLEAFNGQVRIVQFWTFSCHNCTATIPHLQEIYAEHQPNGLEIIGVHAPEFEFEEDPNAVAEAAEDLGVTWPIALDTEKTNFRSWQGDRRFWPRTYILDSAGNIRFDHIGEGRYDDIEATVAWLLENEA